MNAVEMMSKWQFWWVSS